jgi:hypothetical protein
LRKSYVIDHAKQIKLKGRSTTLCGLIELYKRVDVNVRKQFMAWYIDRHVRELKDDMTYHISQLKSLRDTSEIFLMGREYYVANLRQLYSEELRCICRYINKRTRTNDEMIETIVETFANIKTK